MCFCVVRKTHRRGQPGPPFDIAVWWYGKRRQTLKLPKAKLLYRHYLATSRRWINAKNLCRNGHGIGRHIRSNWYSTCQHEIDVNISIFTCALKYFKRSHTKMCCSISRVLRSRSLVGSLFFLIQNVFPLVRCRIVVASFFICRHFVLFVSQIKSVSLSLPAHFLISWLVYTKQSSHFYYPLDVVFCVAGRKCVRCDHSGEVIKLEFTAS